MQEVIPVNFNARSFCCICGCLFYAIIKEDSSSTRLQKKACSANEVTPACLRTLYGFDDYKVQAADKNSTALTSYNDEFFRRRLKSRKDGFTLPYIRHDAPSRAYPLHLCNQVPSAMTGRASPEKSSSMNRIGLLGSVILSRRPQTLSCAPSLGPATPVLPLVWPAPPTFGRPQPASIQQPIRYSSFHVSIPSGCSS
jgi:hypothetical protein